MQERDHDAVTIDQFTKQADSFASLHTAHTDADILRLIAEAARVGNASRVLDVACGPGLVALYLAEAAGHVVGLDITPAMLDKAGERQREQGLVNLSWELGRADALPYADGSFDAVVTRFSFHHLVDPAKGLLEMVRACKPGGRVVVCDVYTSTPEQAAEYDGLERLRDPSHVHALRLEELRALLADADLEDRMEAFARLPMILDRLLAGSFPAAGGADEIRRSLAADLGRDFLCLSVRQEGEKIAFEFPVVVLGGTRRG